MHRRVGGRLHNGMGKTAMKLKSDREADALYLLSKRA